MRDSADGMDSNRFLLQNAPLFCRACADAHEYLLRHSMERRFRKGEIICRKDSPACTMFLVKSGLVSELAMDMNEFSTVAVMKGRYDYFGELGVLLEEGYTTTAVAMEDTVLLAIPASVFRRYVWENPEAVKEILRLYRRGLQNSARKFISCTNFNVEGRLAYILLMMHNEYGSGHDIQITQETLSKQCGISRQTVSMILNSWKKRAVLAIHRGGISVLDTEMLANIAMENAKMN